MRYEVPASSKYNDSPPMSTMWHLPVSMLRIRRQSEEFRPMFLSLMTSLRQTMVLNAELKSINITLRLLLPVGKACVPCTENGISCEVAQFLWRSACSSSEVCHLNRVKKWHSCHDNTRKPSWIIMCASMHVCVCVCVCISVCLGAIERVQGRQRNKQIT